MNSYQVLECNPVKAVSKLFFRIGALKVTTGKYILHEYSLNKRL